VALVVSVSPGSTGVFFEGFEDGTLGAMAPMNIDAGKFSLDASDGYRCQYNDPDWINSNDYVPSRPGQSRWESPSDCYLGATEEQGEEFFWNVVDGEFGGEEGRSYTGRYSVRMGAISGTNPPALTAPMGTLEAIVTAEPLRIGSGPSELSFKHQISLPDSRTTSCDPGRSADGGVVQVQVLNPIGHPVGDWRTLTAYANGYDQQREDKYVNCMFDPTDDGNNEDDFYDPDDPLRRLGPSSLCYDQWVFVYMGDTDEPFDLANVGNAEEESGLEGETGLGTWVESRFDLSAFRGKRILIRFITSGLKTGRYETYEDLFAWNPIPADDGWWIDDITVTGIADDEEELAAVEAEAQAPAGDGLKVLQARP